MKIEQKMKLSEESLLKYKADSQPKITPKLTEVSIFGQTDKQVTQIHLLRNSAKNRTEQ
jgi:hypothetical protein